MEKILIYTLLTSAVMNLILSWTIIKLNKELNDFRKDSKETLEKLKKDVRSLIWCVCNQREKVEGVMISIISQIYPPNICEDLKVKIRKKFQKRIYGEDLMNARHKFFCNEEEGD